MHPGAIIAAISVATAEADDLSIFATSSRIVICLTLELSGGEAVRLE
jgi:hypothetical protein